MNTKNNKTSHETQEGKAQKIHDDKVKWLTEFSRSTNIYSYSVTDVSSSKPNKRPTLFVDQEFCLGSMGEHVNHMLTSTLASPGLNIALIVKGTYHAQMQPHMKEIYQALYPLMHH